MWPSSQGFRRAPWSSIWGAGRATGGLADTVVDASEEAVSAGKATGFVFRPYTAEALHTAVLRALLHFKARDRWTALVHNAMRQDFSWGRSAREYVALYRKWAG
jgi:starch synthase